VPSLFSAIEIKAHPLQIAGKILFIDMPPIISL